MMNGPATEQSASASRRFRLKGFQLDEDPHALLVVILLVILLLYGAIDGFITPAEGYAGSPPYGLFALIGICGAALAIRWVRAGAAPVRESWGLGLLFGVVAAFSAYAGILRINALVYAERIGAYDYVLDADRVLRAQEGGLPPIETPIDRYYWQEQSPGAQWRIELRQGLLGVWQYRREPLQKTIDGFYEMRALIEAVRQREAQRRDR